MRSSTNLPDVISRRDFLKLFVWSSGLAALLTACGREQILDQPFSPTATSDNVLSEITPEMTVTPSATATATSEPIQMTEADRQIWDAMPEKMPDIEDSHRVFDRERGFLYKDSLGQVIGLYDYNPYKLTDTNINRICSARYDEESNQIWFVDNKDKSGKERVKYPEVFKVTLRDEEGNVIENKFNDVEIHTTSRNFLLNPALSREVVGQDGDFAQMMAILEEAYKQKLIPQFVEEGAMKLNDLVRGNPVFDADTILSNIWDMPDSDAKSKRWLHEDVAPYTPAVFPPQDDTLGAEFAPVMVTQNNGEVSGWWSIQIPDSEQDLTNGIVPIVQQYLDNCLWRLGGNINNGDEYVRGGMGISYPFIFNPKGEEALIYYSHNDPSDSLLALFHELGGGQEYKQIYSEMITGKTIPDVCKDGTLPAFARFFKRAFVV